MRNLVVNPKLARSFDAKEIKNKVSNLNIKRSGNTVVTKINNRVVCETEVSNKYMHFDFGEFISKIIDKIDNYFDPLSYYLTFNGGIQELRVYGKEHQLNGETYHEMFNILNSTNKLKSLQMNIGLLRLVCTNGMVVSVGDMVSIRAKHYAKTLGQKVEEFNEKMLKYDTSIKKQIEVISALIHTKFLYGEMVKLMALDKDGSWNKNSLTRTKAWSKKMLISPTDSMKELNSSQRSMLLVPDRMLTYKNDFDIDAYKAFNCYMELFKEQDSAVIRRETDRFLKFTNQLS